MIKYIKHNSGRVFFIGDLHGQLGQFNAALEAVNFDKSQDIVIATGDLVDRGPDSLGCLNLIYEPWFYTVKGNHEEMMVQSVMYSDRRWDYCWYMNGGNWYHGLDDSEQSLINIEDVNNLPLIIELDVGDKKVVVCHATFPLSTYDPPTSLTELEAERLLWGRALFEDCFFHGRNEDIGGADLFVFGHTGVRTVTKFANQCYIDTGYYKPLELYSLESLLS